MAEALSTTEAKQLNDTWYVITQGAQKPDGSGRTDIRQLLYDAATAATEQSAAIKALTDQVTEIGAKLEALTTSPPGHYTASGDIILTPTP